MARNHFKFKQFTVHQGTSVFRVTTDSVLLGAWAAVEGAAHIVDIGTGTGLLALMAAQRSVATIVAIEPDRNAFMQAGVNITNSPWHERITLLISSIQDYRPAGNSHFDAIITNPPYFVDSLLNPDEAKARARHTVTLSRADLLVAAARLLAPAGMLHLALPVVEAGRFVELARDYNLHLMKRMFVRPTLGVLPTRALMSLQLGIPERYDESEIVIEKGGRHNYSDEYVSLTKDFYLRF
ncbi:MAG: methyltransferase [Bacteroidales bacterium]|nr:methyltransferase [Bacteroidales bacterium]